MRVAFYMLQAASADTESQKQGIQIVIQIFNPTTSTLLNDPNARIQFRRLLACSPVRFSTIHICFPSSALSNNPQPPAAAAAATDVAVAAGAELPTSSAASSNTDSQQQEEMKTSSSFGIPPIVEPTTSSSSSHGPYYRPVTEATMTLLDKDERVRTKFHEGKLRHYVFLSKSTVVFDSSKTQITHSDFFLLLSSIQVPSLNVTTVY